ncbi:hypothetical protein ITI46_12520 [Streptomyces oryzae]|uniref:Uncharacterized protein n=1 Tax=Streptomyces oryzae TaxID=1434886 RepID=A0ABS3XAR8_9ACTN|nr:hypothetical protein [Streptomyces oryzae]MBO8192482.1 hypothetical protein [Streptomyces oryzae]
MTTYEAAVERYFAAWPAPRRGAGNGATSPPRPADARAPHQPSRSAQRAR